MAIDQEVAIGGVLVLANARFDNRRGFQGRESAGDEILRPVHTRSRDQPGLRVRIDVFAMRVAGKFQAARLNVRHTVGLFLLEQPCRQKGRDKARVTRGCAEEEYFLASREDSLAKQLWKHFAEPWAARKHELAGGDS